MKYINAIVIMFLALNMAIAQNYTINKTSGKLNISEVARVTVIGHAGAGVEIELEGEYSGLPERAEGLKLISALGLTDNTGIGLSATTDGDVTNVTAVSNKNRHRYIVKVPRGVSVNYEYSSHDGGDLILKNLPNEVEASLLHNGVVIENCTGPMAISSVHGSIDAVFNDIAQENAISLYSVHDHVDVSVPANAKANFKLNTAWGEMFTDLDLDYGDEEDGMKKVSRKKVVGKFNGGGVDFNITSTHNNIYLRKKS